MTRLSEPTQEVVCPESPHKLRWHPPGWYKELGEAGAAQDGGGCWADVRKSAHQGRPRAGCGVHPQQMEGDRALSSPSMNGLKELFHW